MQEILADVFGFMALLCLVLLIIGLFSPRMALFWSKKAATRVRAARINGIATVVFLFVCGMFARGLEEREAVRKAPDESTQAPAAAKPEPVYSFELVGEERESGYLRFKLVMPELYPRQALIEKTRQLRAENRRYRKMVCDFYYKKYSEQADPVAGLAYLPDCSDCADKDKEGNPIDFPFYHLEKPLADSLLALTFDTAGFKLEARFISIGSKMIQLIFSSKGKAAAEVFLGTGGHFSTALIKKMVDGEARFYDPEDNMSYYVIDRQAGFVDYYGEKGLEMQMVLEE